MFILYLEWKERCLTDWGGSCFTRHWTESSTCARASWMLFFRFMCAVKMAVGFWRGGGGCGSQSDLERSSVPLRTPLSYLNQSNTVTLVPWEPWDLLENAGDSLKSSAEITTLFMAPPETCAKSCSCTYLSFALAHLKKELNSYLNTSSAWMERLQTCCSCAFLAGNQNLG